MQSAFRCFCCTAMLLASGAAARGLTVDPGAAGVRAGVFPSPAIVDGRPAIAYADDQTLAVHFVRAMDDTGSAWGTPVAVAGGPQVGGRVSLVVAGGYPAVSYYDFSSKTIKFVRATNPGGSAWGTPVAVD